MTSPHWCHHDAGGVLVATAIVPGDARIDRLTGETIASVTFRTAAGHLVSFLRTLGSFSTTTVPDLTHVHHYRGQEEGRGDGETLESERQQQTETLTEKLRFLFCFIFFVLVVLPVQVKPSPS